MKTVIMVMIASLLLPGCGSLLPSSRATVQSPWHSYEEARESFDRIVINKTTIRELSSLGFDPFSTPNIKILTYLEVMNRFMPNPSIRKENLDEGIQRCIDAQGDCKALEFDPGVTKSRRHGNFWLDFFNFKRESEESGWKFKAFIVLVDDVVVYKLAGGNPRVSEQKITRNPLGPLQSADSIITEATKSTVR